MFVDADGTSWEVWDVRPAGAAEIVQVRNQFAEGWLAFQSERLPSGLFRYSAPEGLHDDCVISLALAYQALAHQVDWSQY